MTNLIWWDEPIHIPPKDKPVLELIDMTVVNINKKSASKVLSILVGQAPLLNYKHLKRVRRLEGDELQAVVCTVIYEKGGGWSEEEFGSRKHERMPAELLKKLQDYVLSISTVGVPKFAPEELVQSREWNKIWPLNFKIPPGKAAIRSAEIILSEKEKGDIKSGLEKAWEAAHSSSEMNGVCNGAVIVDPTCNRIISIGSDERTTQGRCHPLRHAAIVAIEGVAADTLKFWSNPINKKRNYCMLADEYSDFNAHDEVSEGARTKFSNSNGPYLCTGYDCYIVKEPCTMCAMALVHSRVRRIVYCDKDTKHGALGGSYRLHGTVSLNHHYEVFHWQAQMRKD